MHPVRLLLLIAAAPAAAAAQAPSAPAPAPAAHRNAREQAPAALIGPWKVDLAASRYSGAKPKVATRTFQYTEDGKLLVTFQSVSATGNYVTGHWAAQVDGTPANEYHSAAGAIPYNVVRLWKVDENNLKLTVTRNGKLDIEATYALSPDGRTLTYSYGGNSIVYRRWTALD
ncbi:MAG: hypothetical protein PGN09_11500 [Sphingomonas fennica]